MREDPKIFLSIEHREASVHLFYYVYPYPHGIYTKGVNMRAKLDILKNKGDLFY